jgi:colanic acid biosynthesis glycosyl transferase WcaI
MKVIFVNRFFHPDISATSQIASDLALQFAADGKVVHVVTSRLRYDDPEVTLPSNDEASGVIIHRVWTTRFGRTSTLGRLCDYVTFYVAAPLAVIRLALPGDVVIVKTDPPMISVSVLIAARLRGVRVVNWLQDLFPEVAIALGMKLGGASMRAVLIWIRNCSLRWADANVVLGSRMQVLVAQHAPNVPIYVVPNWSPAMEIAPLSRIDNPLNDQWQLAGRFIVGYSGNLGRAHDLGIVLEAADRLRDQLEIMFLIIGEGNQKESLQAEVRSRGLTNVLFKTYQPKEQLKFSLALPNVHLISLKPVLEGMIVPSKFYGVIAAGRPVIFIGDKNGEIAREVTRGYCGMTMPPDDPNLLAKIITQLCGDTELCERMGKNARAFFEAEYSQSIAIDKWRRVLDAVQH